MKGSKFCLGQGLCLCFDSLEFCFGKCYAGIKKLLMERIMNMLAYTFWNKEHSNCWRKRDQ